MTEYYHLTSQPNYPKLSEMQIEIISVPFAELEESGWYLKCQIIDLNSRPYMVSHHKFPLSQNELLPIAVSLDDELVISKRSGIEQDFEILNFDSGLIHPVRELPEAIYLVESAHPIHDDTLVYSIYHNGRRLVFFTYELFRQFIGFNNIRCQYIFEPEMIDVVIDNEEVVVEDGKRTIVIEFNEHLPVTFARDDAFVYDLAFLLSHVDIRRYWNEILSNRKGKKNSFAFKKPPFETLNCKAQVKKYKDFDLVLHIRSITPIQPPFDDIKIKHPKIKEGKGGGSGKRGGTKKKEEDVPKDLKFEDKPTSPNAKKTTTITIDKPGLKFATKITIERVKTPSDNKGGGSGETRRLFTDFKLTNMSLSFNQSDKEGTAVMPILKDHETDNSFDFTEIPSGLQLFCNAIGILSKKLNIKYEYEIIQYPKTIESSFATVGGERRKAVLITLPANPNIFLLEIDSSDGRFISTLIYKGLRVEKPEFFEKLFERQVENSGSWDMKYLETVCVADTIRHPRYLPRYDDQSKDEINKSLMNRIAFNLISILI